jgi:hypothetical protein
MASLTMVGTGAMLGAFGSYWGLWHSQNVVTSDMSEAKQVGTLDAYTNGGAGYVGAGSVLMVAGVWYESNKSKQRTIAIAALVAFSVILLSSVYSIWSQWDNLTESPINLKERTANAVWRAGVEELTVASIGSAATWYWGIRQKT